MIYHNNKMFLPLNISLTNKIYNNNKNQNYIHRIIKVKQNFHSKFLNDNKLKKANNNLIINNK